jgi:DNA polymerase-3 subunit alpha
MVYQEQVMRILNRLGGIDLASAYACIKAISKKKQDIIDARQADFIAGAQERGVSRATAEEIFGLIVHFGGYGFNKSHTAAYAQIGYQTAYLKANFTPEFMAALLSSEIDDGNKRDVFVDHIADAKRLGVVVRPPSVNESTPDFTVNNGEIVFGLMAIKGIGRNAAGELNRARPENGRYHDLFDLCERVDQKIVQRAALERLIKAGACDDFGHRAALLAGLPSAIQSADERQQDRRRGQMNMFDVLDASAAEVVTDSLPNVPEWSDAERLKNEKEALDFYLSSHPLAACEGEIRRFSTHSVEQLKNSELNQEVLLGGILTQVRFMNTKRPGRNGHSRFARCNLEDFTGSVECMMWPDEFVRNKDEFAEDRIVFVKGVVELRSEQPKLVLTRVFGLEAARRELTRSLILTIPLIESPPSLMDQLARELKRSPGACVVWLNVLDADGRRAVLRAGDAFRVNPAAIDLNRLESLLGVGKVLFSGR